MASSAAAFKRPCGSPDRCPPIGDPSPATSPFAAEDTLMNAAPKPLSETSATVTLSKAELNAYLEDLAINAVEFHLDHLRHWHAL